MSEKHYNSKYLDSTGAAIKELKLASYEPLLGIQSGLIVDLGCGTGNDVIEMSRNSKSKFVGLDHDPTLLQIGTKNAEGIQNVEFVLTESDSLPFKNAEVSGLRAERLIQHLPDPNSTFREIHRVLANEAPLVLIETDWSSLIFYNELVEIATKISKFLTDEKVKAGYAARNLIRYVKDSGFIDIHISLHPFVVTSLKDANEFLWLDKILIEMETKGHLTHGEILTFNEKIYEADESNIFLCSLNLVMLTCKK